jgi:hypothetical protein
MSLKLHRVTHTQSQEAELIVQIAPPLEFEFADETLYAPRPDSVFMMLFYRR